MNHFHEYFRNAMDVTIPFWTKKNFLRPHEIAAQPVTWRAQPIIIVSQLLFNFYDV